ncbi:hypothetical protein [Salinimicrobium sp. GXAS 041]|uniref:hypothetical protein n=1 Tax=Salinimicrobium sp. GXAS 041 TaxID=3400806 RepID=UPI003C7346C6
MTKFNLGFIFTRIFLQKRIEISENISIIPLSNTGSNGLITDIRNKLNEIGYPLSQSDYIQFLTNHADTGQSILLELRSIEASEFNEAIDKYEDEAIRLVNNLAVISLNPPQLILCYALSSSVQNGVKFFVPKDRKISHATNIPGFLDAIPDLVKESNENPKFRLLISLFKSALEQSNWRNKALYLLILFEEASDNETGSLAARLKSHSEKQGYFGDLDLIAQEIGVSIPEGKSVIDLVVKLRNSATHNGTITEESLNEFNGDWVVPIIKESEKFVTLLIESARYMLMTLVGHDRNSKALKITGTTEIKFE